VGAERQAIFKHTYSTNMHAYKHTLLKNNFKEPDMPHSQLNAGCVCAPSFKMLKLSDEWAFLLLHVARCLLRIVFQTNIYGTHVRGYMHMCTTTNNITSIEKLARL